MIEAVYMHPAPVRVWHWVNAFAISFLVVTGAQLRFPEHLQIFPMRVAVDLHNYISVLVVGSYLMWLVFYVSTGRIQVYFPSPRSFVTDAVNQARFYCFGFFKGEPNAHNASPENKFNPLQQLTYLGIMFVLLPAQIVSGILLWRVKTFESVILDLGGLKIVDSIHVILSFMFMAFLIFHVYLSTMGHKPSAHFKAMFTGYHEHE